jgi:uracil-DNA glycosylase
VAETLSGRPRDLFLTIARCPVIRGVREGRFPSSPCQRIVKLQEHRRLESHIAEPWLGHIDRAPILFVASNPGRGDGDGTGALGEEGEDALIDIFINYFGGGRRIYNIGGIRGVDASGKPDRRWVRYWAFARRRAIELLGEPVLPGESYALTEVVHCNSKSEATGAVSEALDECMPRYLDPVLELAAAKVIVVVGEVAGEAFRRRGFDPKQRVIGPVHLGRRPRMIVFMPHPNKRGGSKSFAGNVPEHLDHLRTLLKTVSN